MIQNNVLNFCSKTIERDPNANTPGMSPPEICFRLDHLFRFCTPSCSSRDPTHHNDDSDDSLFNLHSSLFRTWAECSPALLLLADVLTGKLCKHATIIYTASPPTPPVTVVLHLWENSRWKVVLETEFWEETEKITYFQRCRLAVLKNPLWKLKGKAKWNTIVPPLVTTSVIQW